MVQHDFHAVATGDLIGRGLFFIRCDNSELPW